MSGLVSGDTASGFTQSFASKNVMGPDGSTLVVNPGSGTINDGNNGNNDTLVYQTPPGTVTVATLTAALVGAVVKAYDRTTIATLSPDNDRVTEIIGSDDVTLNRA